MKMTTIVLIAFGLFSLAGCQISQTYGQPGQQGQQTGNKLTDGPPSPGRHGPLSASDYDRDGTVTRAEIEEFMYDDRTPVAAANGIGGAGTSSAANAGSDAGGSSATITPGSAGTVGAGAMNCPCSRRPGANNSFKCAVGVGETITQIVGPAGGVVLLHAQQGASSGVDFRVDIPPNSFSENVEVRITETTNPPPTNLVDYSPIYRVEPTEVLAQFPLKLTVPFGGNDGAITKTLAIYVADDSAGPFEPISDSYINAGFLQGSTMHFGAFLAGAPRSSAQAACP